MIADPRAPRARPSEGEAGPGRGGAMFAGRVPLRGRIRGHAASLPPEVVACVNCHGGVALGRRRSGDAAAPPVAPRLDRGLLTEARPRRGGPPSAYDATSFCRLLRDGVDPAFVVVAREMPSYDLDAASCLALWRYLTAIAKGSEGDLHGDSRKP